MIFFIALDQAIETERKFGRKRVERVQQLEDLGSGHRELIHLRDSTGGARLLESKAKARGSLDLSAWYVVAGVPGYVPSKFASVAAIEPVGPAGPTTSSMI